MAFELREFRERMEAIQVKYISWFAAHPSIGEGPVNSIHDHYYIFLGKEGHQLRFRTDSSLPVLIREEMREEFAREQSGLQ